MFCKGTLVLNFLLYIFCFIFKAHSNYTDTSFVVSLQYMGAHFCSGSVVKPNVILTCAHCFLNQDRIGEKLDSVRVRAGSHLRIDNPTEKGKLYEIDRFIVHHGYHFREHHEDLALAVLKEPIDNVTVVELSDKRPSSFEECYLLGWGRIFDNGPISNELTDIELYVEENIACAINPYFYRGQICLHPEPHLITGHQCDSGSVLICSDGRQGGVGQFRLGYGNFYFAADVSKYREWIMENDALIYKANLLLILLSIMIVMLSLNKILLFL